MIASATPSTELLEKVIEFVNRGVQVELILRTGTKITNFRVHEVIAPERTQRTPDEREPRIRGIVWPDRGTHRDEYVQVRDVQSICDERVGSFFASEEFFQRHPLPLGWVRLARCPTAPRK